MNKKINKDILRLAAPAIINNITVPLLGLCDTAIAGHLGSEAFLGAISVGTMMLNVFFWLAGFLRMGTTGLTARSFGRGSGEECREVIFKSLILAAAISAFVLCLQIPILNLLLSVISPEGEAASLAALYFRIGVWWVPAQLTIMAVSGWFIGLQTTVVPMVIAITTNIINIGISVFLTFGIGWGFKGVIYGTLIANWVGAVIAIAWMIFMLRKIRTSGVENKYSHNSNPLKVEVKKKSEKDDNRKIRWRDLFNVNGALFLRSACIMAVTITVTSLGARMGELTLAVNAIIMQFFIFFSYFMDGFAFSGEALAGKYSGQGNHRMVVKTAIQLCKWGVGMAILFFLIYLFFSYDIIALLTDNVNVKEEIGRYRIWILLLPPVTVAAFIFDGIFVGLTKTVEMMKVTVAGAAAFFILLFLAPISLDNNLLWIAFLLYLLIRGGALGIIFKKKYGSERWK